VLHPKVLDWYQRRTFSADAWTANGLLRRKRRARQPSRISVVLPALDEEATVGGIVAAIRTELLEQVPLVDEIVVVDSGSVDQTAAVAAAAGATVVSTAEILPHLGNVAGKGEALWKSLYATTGDIVVFVDSDLHDFSTRFIVGLLGPLLTRTEIAYVKAVYDRPLRTGEISVPAGGGRVTELVARPLLNLHWPELAGFVQPLAGEYAGRRSVLEEVPFVSGYGVEIGLLVDLLDLVGLDGLAQSDLGERSHAHQHITALGMMSSAILQTALARLASSGRLSMAGAVETSFTQFVREGGEYVARTAEVMVSERPPMITVPAYADRRRAQTEAQPAAGA
jgi:glucosyl-3-phosphoglycerate synthase